MNLFKVDKTKCHKDGICAAVCPRVIIDFKKGEFPTPAAGAEEMCIKCGHCVAACPHGSFLHSEISLDECPEIPEKMDISPEQCKTFLQTRRSVRAYKDKPVEKEQIEKLIDIVRYAPTGHNCQCVEWLVIQDKNKLEQMEKGSVEWMKWMLENKRKIALSVHMDEALKRYEQGYNMVLRDAPALLIAHAEKENGLASVNCTIALTYFELAAKSMGLGTCWAGIFYFAAISFPLVSEMLDLPESNKCFGAMMLGYPKVDKYQRIPLRKKPLVKFI